MAIMLISDLQLQQKRITKVTQSKDAKQALKIKIGKASDTLMVKERQQRNKPIYLPTEI